MLRKIAYLLLLLFVPLYINAQEFTLKKTPEEEKRAKELKEEKDYLKFQEHFFNAIQQKAKEDYAKAIQHLEDCKQIYPDDIGLNFEFAKNYYELKDFDNAIFFNNKILETAPDNLYVLEHLKKIYRTQKDFESAIDIQHKIIAINPKKKQDLLLLYVSSRDKSKAKSLFIEMEKSHQTITNKAYYKRVLFPKKNTSKPKVTPVVKSKNRVTSPTANSIKELQKQFAKNKDYKTLKKLLIKEEKQLKFDILVSDSKNGLELFPAQPFVYLMQGKAHNKLAKYQNAIEVLKAGLDFVIDNNELESNFYKELHQAYLGLGNTNEATKYLNKANKLK